MSKDLGAKVRAALFEIGMSQTELAKTLDISTAYLSDIINGKKDGPKAKEHVKKIKMILKI